MRIERFLPDWDGDVPELSRRRVVLYQLPLSVTLLLLLNMYAAVNPGQLGDPRLHSSVIPHVIIIGVCAVVPWGRLPEQWTLLIPLLDMFAIGLSREVDPIASGAQHDRVGTTTVLNTSARQASPPAQAPPLKTSAKMSPARSPELPDDRADVVRGKQSKSLDSRADRQCHV